MVTTHMDPLLLVAAGFLLLVFVVTIPVMRTRYGERYEDERAFFREQRPTAWGFIGDVAGGDYSAAQDRATGRCPRCETENDPDYTYCRNCDCRLPTRDE